MKIIRIIMLLGLLPLLASCSSDGLGFDSAEQAGAGRRTGRSNQAVVSETGSRFLQTDHRRIGVWRLYRGVSCYHPSGIGYYG